jgi:hypothetical protein
VRHKKSPLDEIAGEYTEALAAGDFERAAAWFAVARFVSEREGNSSGIVVAEAVRSAATPGRPPAA